MAKKKDYFISDDRTINIICAILLPVAFILGVITRFQDGKPVAAILRFITGWNIVWILDLIFMIKEDKIFRLLDC
ncbi:MAG: hypothetical protein IJW25_02695 [Clostridia bacterium]|nr:hypothetical protein [Clostridia bacterium]